MSKKVEKIDFAAEMKKTAALIASDKINAIVLAPSGGGKSCLAGTFGEKTLYLYGSSEAHGPKNAIAYSNCEVVPICIDSGRSPDEALEFVLAVLGDKEFIGQFGAVVLDSSNAIELLIKDSERFKTMCISTTGRHNSYAESGAALQIFSEILNAMRSTGKHTLLTCILDVREIDTETNEVLDSSPRISTYALAEGICLQHADIFTVGKLIQGEKEGHRIQFTARMNKASKDLAGRVKKTQNYTPRLAGYKGDLPASMPADMSKLIAFKRGEKK